MRGVGQAELFKRDGGLAAVWRRPSIKIDHGMGPVVKGKIPAHSREGGNPWRICLRSGSPPARGRAAIDLRGAFLTPKPGRGNIGAVADRFELEPDHRLDHPFASRERAKAA